MKAISLLLWIMVLACSAYGSELSGIATITDGDTVVISGTKIRLLDMDAPETDQYCLDKDAAAWNCGISARDALKTLSDGKIWACKTDRLDVTRRMLASCTVDGENVSQWMVRRGWAMSPVHKGYSHKFDFEEKAARETKAGMWAGAFIAPWDWRRRNCHTEVHGAVAVSIDAQKKLCGSPSNPPDLACTIKATMRNGSCIYHSEGGYYYGALKMSGSNKRWFCTKLEAEAAGCRPAKR